MSENQNRSDPDVVVSTVRRVVSGPAAQRGGGDGSPERLLLTPALRVDEGDGADMQDPAPAPIAPSGPRRRTRVQTRTLAAERISLEQRIAELERAVGDGEGWEPDGSEPIDEETPTRFVFDGPRRSTLPDLPSEDAHGTVTLVDENDLVRADVESAPVHDSRPVPEARPDTGPEAGPEPDPEIGLETGPQSPDPDAPDLTADPRDAAETSVAALRPVPLAEPGSPTIPPVSEPAASAEPPATKAPGSEPAGLDLDDERIIDEEALRDIVAEIVRAELQGELGERITRNVRKLVRREIHRAIMTRDFG